MRKTTLFIGFSILLMAAFSLGSCHKHEEGELITTIKITLTPKDSGNAKTFVWSDPDGIGGNAPTQTDTIVCDSGKAYLAAIQFFNGDNDITTEIKNEASEHLVCYTGPTSNILAIAYNDSDGQYPIGLETKWQAGKISSGLVRINLKHQPKSKNGTCDPGESDVDVSFPFSIK